MPHITVGICVTWSCWMWLLQFSWLGRNSAWSADGKLQVSLVKFQVCHAHWEPSQALPCPAEMGFSLCLSSCSSKDRHADVYVGEFLWHQSLLKCCLSFLSGGMGSACFLWNPGCELACWVKHMWLRLVAYRPWQLSILGGSQTPCALLFHMVLMIRSL